MARSLRSLRQVATLSHSHMARRSAPAFRAQGVCEHIWPFSLRAFGRHYCRRNGLKFLSPKWLVTKRPRPGKNLFSGKNLSAKKTERGDTLVSPGMVCYAGKQEKPFWFSSLGQMVQFGAIIFCRTWSLQVYRKN